MPIKGVIKGPYGRDILPIAGVINCPLRAWYSLMANMNKKYIWYKKLEVKNIKPNRKKRREDNYPPLHEKT
jgi:hypothetical protein